MNKIIVIDDDPDILEASEVVLSSVGFKVITASDADSGYEMIIKENPQLIILDVMMKEPDDGFFLAQKLRKENITTPILMYTSISKSIGMDYGAGELVPVDEFVEKPISPDQLIAKVEKLLHIHIER
jgi:DNA-binding response OmpR family regulator